MQTLGVTEAVILFFFVGIIVVYVLYLNTLRKTILTVSPENRKLRPGEVWLLLIPIFAFVWQFVLVAKIADSLRAEYQSRGMTPSEDRPGYQIGLAMSICLVATFLPLLGGLIAFAGFICWIIYWNKMDGYRKELESLNSIL